MLPSLFISHGSPMLALRPSPARDFLAGLGAQVDRPKAIVIASGHWETERPEVSAVVVNDTIHDFYGFPPALYAMRYPAPGSPELAERIAALLRDAGLAVKVDHERGLDHGAWVPLSLMYPDHDIPVLQLALQSRQGPLHHLQLGRAIAALREQNVLVIGSGSFTHNLGRPRAPNLDAAPPPDIIAFSDWMHAALTEQRVDDVLDYRRKAPYATLQHPTEEHLLPLFVALGAAGDGAHATRLHASTTWGTLRMDAVQLRSLMRLFVYGTLRDPDTLAKRGGAPLLAAHLGIRGGLKPGGVMIDSRSCRTGTDHRIMAGADQAGTDHPVTAGTDHPVTAGTDYRVMAGLDPAICPGTQMAGSSPAMSGGTCRTSFSFPVGITASSQMGLCNDSVAASDRYVASHDPLVSLRTLIPAILPGWRRVAMPGGRYPTLRRDRRGNVRGALVTVSARVLTRLAAYEGPTYRLVRVVVDTPNGKTAAHTWIAPGGTRLPWRE